MIDARTRAASLAAALSCALMLISGCASPEPASVNEPLGMPESDLSQEVDPDCIPTGNFRFEKKCIGGMQYIQQVEEWCCQENGAVWYEWRAVGAPIPTGGMWTETFAGTGHSSTIHVTHPDGAEYPVVVAEITSTQVVWMPEAVAATLPPGESELEPLNLLALEVFDAPDEGNGVPWDLVVLDDFDGVYVTTDTKTRVSGHSGPGADPDASIAPLFALPLTRQTADDETLQAVLVDVRAWVAIRGGVHVTVH